MRSAERGDNRTAPVLACKTRAILNEQQAVTIYKIKLSNKLGENSKSACATSIANLFGVSEKAVRDIWTGRTWSRETIHLDPARLAVSHRTKSLGSPRGSKAQARPAVCYAQRIAPNVQSTTLQMQCSDEVNNPVENNSSKAFPIVARSSEPCATCAHIDSARRPKVQVPSAAVPQQPALPEQSWQWIGVTESAEELPLSSDAEDPFHDDWPHWAPQVVGPTCQGVGPTHIARFCHH